MANVTPHLLPRGERLLQGTIAELLSDSATEVEVNNPPSVDELPTYFELDPSSDNPETIRVYDVSGNIIYFERGVYNSGVGREHLPNTPYKQKITSRHWKEVVDAVESGYLLEDPSLTITRDGDNQFTVKGVDRTAFYTLGRILRINGSDASTVVVLSSLLSGSDTEVIIDSAYTLPTPINTVELAIFARGAMDELVLKGATQTLTNKTLTSPVLNTGVSGTAVLDDDTFATASATTIPTSESVKAYVDAGTLLTAAPSADVTVSGTRISLTAGENLAFGNIGYIKSDGKVWKADADAIATSSAIVMATATISANAAGMFLLQGIARNDAWNWTVGGLIYLSTTAGDMTQTAPSGADDVIQILGVATHAERMFFNPQLIQVEHV